MACSCGPWYHLYWMYQTNAILVWCLINGWPLQHKTESCWIPEAVPLITVTPQVELYRRPWICEKEFGIRMPIIKNVPICVVRKCQAPPKNESIWWSLSFVVLNKEMRKLMFATRLASNQILLFPWEQGFCQNMFHKCVTPAEWCLCMRLELSVCATFQCVVCMWEQQRAL